MGNYKITTSSEKKANNAKRTNKNKYIHKGGAHKDLEPAPRNNKITNTLKKNANNSKRKNKTEENQIMKLNKKFINQLGGDCGAPGCTDGDLGNLLGRFGTLGKDVYELVKDIVMTGEWMIVDMPQELVGATENPSVNTPLTNII